jgi:glycosyltransferase involved in cell wall biosynthesis
VGLAGLPRPMTHATVVIPVFNDSRGLAEVLAAIDQQTIRDSLHVVVIDNESSDDSFAVARRQADEVRRIGGGAGSSAARNLGLELTTTPFLLTLDADTIPATPEWAEIHLDALENAALDVVGSAGKLLPRPSDDRWAQREDVTPAPQFLASGEPSYAVNGSACYRAAIVGAIGGYPNVGANDAGLGFRARAAGYRYIWTPTASVYHRNPQGLRGYYRQMVKVGGYAAELEGRPESRSRWFLGQCRYILSQGRPLLGLDPQEALAGVIRAVGQTQGAIAVWGRG